MNYGQTLGIASVCDLFLDWRFLLLHFSNGTEMEEVFFGFAKLLILVADIQFTFRDMCYGCNLASIKRKLPLLLPHKPSSSFKFNAIKYGRALYREWMAKKRMEQKKMDETHTPTAESKNNFDGEGDLSRLNLLSTCESLIIIFFSLYARIPCNDVRKLIRGFDVKLLFSKQKRGDFISNILFSLILLLFIRVLLCYFNWNTLTSKRNGEGEKRRTTEKKKRKMEVLNSCMCGTRLSCGLR